MTETPVTVDLDRLRAVAGRVERCAHTLASFRVPGLDPADLPGAVVSGIAGPAQGAARLTDVLASMHNWADAARISTSAFENADRDNATRM
ncbi:hypothetical protein BH10ACT9_BH10ACT9_20000 [soil metagenome]